MANPFSGIANRWRIWRYGGITGLNYVQANATMTTIITLPWLVGYIFCFMFVPDPFLEPSIIGMSIIWVFYCYGFYAYAKVDATRFRPYPQSQWRFPDGGTRKFTLMIPPDGFTKICTFQDGSQGWKVNLGKRFQYWDKRSDFPFVFDHALFKLPATPDECFQYLSAGEFFHKGIAIKHPACEDISIYVFKWVQDPKGQYVPVCELNDCSLRYEKSLKNASIEIMVNCKYCGTTMSERSLLCPHCRAPNKMKSRSYFMEMAFRKERKERMMLERHTETLEDIVDAREKDSLSFRKEVDRGVTTRRDLYEHITDTKPPLMQRIKGSLFKIALIVIGIIVFLWFIGLI